MKLKIVILITLMVLCDAVIALQFNEKIEIEGGGNLFARTDTDAAKDQVNGTGDQKYTRVLNLQKTATTLTSEYHLSSNLSDRTNHYYAQMNSPDGLEHFISVYSDSDIKSVSTITQSEDKASTDYSIESKSATFSEGITDSSDGKTRKEIAETEISGSFDLESKLVDDGEMVESPSSFDPESMMEKLESTEMAGETGIVDVPESDTVFLVGETKTSVKSVPEKNFTTPNGVTDQVVNAENTKTKVLPDGAEEESQEFGTVLHEDDTEVMIIGETNVMDTAEETESFTEGSGIKEVNGRRIAFIGYSPQTPLGWNTSTDRT